MVDLNKLDKQIEKLVMGDPPDPYDIVPSFTWLRGPKTGDYWLVETIVNLQTNASYLVGRANVIKSTLDGEWRGNTLGGQVFPAGTVLGIVKDYCWQDVKRQLPVEGRQFLYNSELFWTDSIQRADGVTEQFLLAQIDVVVYQLAVIVANDGSNDFDKSHYDMESEVFSSNNFGVKLGSLFGTTGGNIVVDKTEIDFDLLETARKALDWVPDV